MKGILDVVIPHLNYPRLRDCIVSLIKNTPQGVINKIILINQSGEKYDFGGAVDITIETENLGFAKANNTGMRLSDSKYVMCLNDDVVFVNEKWWKPVEETFEKNDKIVCVCPSSIRDPLNGTPVTMEGYEFLEKQILENKNYDLDDEKYDKLLIPHLTAGFCMFAPIFRIDLLNTVKGVVPNKAWWNEAFRYGGGEDYALQWHIARSGLSAFSTGESWVFHWWHKTISPVTHTEGVKYDSSWISIYGKKGENGEIIENPGVLGDGGREDVPTIVIR